MDPLESISAGLEKSLVSPPKPMSPVKRERGFFMEAEYVIKGKTDMQKRFSVVLRKSYGHSDKDTAVVESLAPTLVKMTGIYPAGSDYYLTFEFDDASVEKMEAMGYSFPCAGFREKVAIGGMNHYQVFYKELSLHCTGYTITENGKNVKVKML